VVFFLKTNAIAITRHVVATKAMIVAMVVSSGADGVGL